MPNLCMHSLWLYLSCVIRPLYHDKFTLPHTKVNIIGYKGKSICVLTCNTNKCHIGYYVDQYPIIHSLQVVKLLQPLSLASRSTDGIKKEIFWALHYGYDSYFEVSCHSIFICSVHSTHSHCTGVYSSGYACYKGR